MFSQNLGVSFPVAVNMGVVDIVRLYFVFWGVVTCVCERCVLVLTISCARSLLCLRLRGLIWHELLLLVRVYCLLLVLANRFELARFIILLSRGLVLVTWVVRHGSLTSNRIDFVCIA